MGNEKLANAKEKRFDEFFTQISEIEKEMRYYKEHFKGKTIFCNCDDPEYSNFWRYFQLNFFDLGIKKLVSTHYERGKQSYKMEIVATDLKTQIGIPDYVKTPLDGDGDFRSAECVEILKEADIVITNPPFSLIREYIEQLITYDKKFIIIATSNAIHYKEIFPLIRDNRIWLGYKPISGGMDMIVPEKAFDESKVKKYKINKNGERIINVMGVCWLTNLDIEKRHDTLPLYRTYNSTDYPKYENYDAIEVNKIAEIPVDYFGEIGVPDTFLQKYNPDQFEIIGLGSGYLGQSIGVKGIAKEHKAQMKGHSAAGDLYYLLPDGKPKVPYSRLIIKRKV